MEINHFFRDIYSNKLHTQYMEKLKTNIIQTIYKLKIILSSSFFNSVKHLLIYLLFKESVNGNEQIDNTSSIDGYIHSRD